MAYVDFGYGESSNRLITRDGELLATLGFTWEQLSNEDDPKLSETLKAAQLAINPKWKDPHSGNSWSNVVNVACVLVKHGWKTVDDIPADHPLHERVITGESAEKPVYSPEVE